VIIYIFLMDLGQINRCA